MILLPLKFLKTKPDKLVFIGFAFTITKSYTLKESQQV